MSDRSHTPPRGVEQGEAGDIKFLCLRGHNEEETRMLANATGGDLSKLDALRLPSSASYARHCGPRAIECAEKDLLGMALAACETGVQMVDQLAPSDPSARGVVDIVRHQFAHVLALARGKDSNA